MTWERESERDLAESGFTPALRCVLAADHRVLAAVFVDHEGECVDYVTTLDPFEAKIYGAQLLVLMTDIVSAMGRMGMQSAIEVEIDGSVRSMLMRRIDEEYLLVVVVQTGGVPESVRIAIDNAVTAFREEAHLPLPGWERRRARLKVELREAVGWDFAPVAYTTSQGRTEVTDVLGRWEEAVAGYTCFRVRTEWGIEITLAHDPHTDHWTILSDTRPH